METSEVNSWGVQANSITKLTVFINGRYCLDAVVAQRRKYLDERSFVGAHAGNGIVQLLGVILRQGRHQGDDDLLKIASQLRLELGNEILAVHGLKFVGDFQPLHDAPVSQNVDDGLLVGSETLHRRSQEARVCFGVEGIGRIHGGCALETFVKLHHFVFVSISRDDFL